MGKKRTHETDDWKKFTEWFPELKLLGEHLEITELTLKAKSVKGKGVGIFKYRPKKKQVKHADYVYIRAWGRLMQSFPYYIESQVEQARMEGAPPTAIYKGDEGWECYEGISSDDTKGIIRRFVREYKS